MSLTKTMREIVSRNPRILLIFGPPKVGKTTKLMELPKCLVGDTEQGSQMLKGYIQEINNLPEMSTFITDAMKDIKHGYDYFALDTIDRVAGWIEEDIVIQHNLNNDDKITYFGDLGFGKGWSQQRTRVLKMVNLLQLAFGHIIIVGHRKLASADNGIVSPESLELTGKLRNELMAKADAIGSVFRDEAGILQISFKNSGLLETGSRCKHLVNKVMPFEWKNIYLTEKPKHKE